MTPDLSADIALVRRDLPLDGPSLDAFERLLAASRGAGAPPRFRESEAQEEFDDRVRRAKAYLTRSEGQRTDADAWDFAEALADCATTPASSVAVKP